MPITHLPTVLKGFGYRVRVIDGHSHTDIVNAWEWAKGNGGGGADDDDGDGGVGGGGSDGNAVMSVIIAMTTKGGGSKYLTGETHAASQLPSQPWHTRVPSWELYFKILEELLNGVCDAGMWQFVSCVCDAGM